MPVIVFDDGRVEAGRVLVCRSCSNIRMSLNTLGRPEQDAREEDRIMLAVWLSQGLLEALLGALE